MGGALKMFTGTEVQMQTFPCETRQKGFGRRTSGHMTRWGDVEINVTSREIMAALYKGKTQSLRVVKKTEKAVREASGLLRPRALLTWVDVLTVTDHTVALSSMDTKARIDLTLGSHSDLLRRAEIGLVSVSTIGAALDKKIRELNTEKDYLDAYIYDCMGLLALSKVGDAIKNVAESEAERYGWGVSPSLSPGSLNGWALEEQNKLCSILDLERIRMKKNGGGVLSPFKSVSNLIGLGPGYNSGKVGSDCRVCANRNICQMRQH